MRTVDGSLPTAEFSDDAIILVDKLEREANERELSREEQAVIDVMDTVSLVEEGEGLHEFWQSPIAHEQIINSFDLIGAVQMVDMFNASQWCRSRTTDRSQYTDTESNHLAEIEEELYNELLEIPSLLDAFIEDEMD